MNIHNRVITERDYASLLQAQNITVIDVRAPIEFQQGGFPGAVNLPILDDSERQYIGKIYKQSGNAEAVRVGHKLVSGNNRERKVQSWVQCIYQSAEKGHVTYLTCFRGGQRSQIAQQWLAEKGFPISRFEKGYKHFRQWTLEHLRKYCESHFFRILSGTTGSGKTQLLKEVSSFYDAVDLEGLAHHKGSAFGQENVPQPSQADFENTLWQKILSTAQENPLLLEDESRVIGSVHLPEDLFRQMRASPILLVQEPLSSRVEHIFKDYILQTAIGQFQFEAGKQLFHRYINNTQKIEKRLGSQRASEIIQDIQKSCTQFLDHRELNANKIWIEKLLVWYYDPLYLSSLQRRQPKIEFQGSQQQIAHYLRDCKPVS